MHRKVIPIVILILALAGVAWFYLGERRAAGPALGGSGTIEGTQVEVTPKIAGRIETIAAREGERVTRGQILVQLAHDELDQQLAQIRAAIVAAEANIQAAKDQERLAQTGLRLAQVEYDRAAKLKDSGSVSDQTLDAAAARRDSLRAQAAAAASQIKAAEALKAQGEAQARFVESQIANATLASPIDGIVLSRNLEVGENAFPGSSVLSLVDDRDLWVKVYVAGDVLGRVKIGQKARVTVDTFPGRAFPGEVVFVSPVAEFTPKNVQTQEERVRLVYAVKVRVDGTSGELKPGMPADVEIVEE